MTYYRDFSRYTYSDSIIPDLNVGWLGRWRGFETGGAGLEFMEVLALQAAMPRNLTRGSHPCYFCSKLRLRGVMVSAREFRAEYPLGNGEIHAISRSGEVFSAPNMIYHYVDRHGYSPPKEFIRAVLDGRDGKVPDSVIRRFRELVERAPRIEDRVDAAIDLIQVASSSSVNWLGDLIEIPSCHPYFKERVTRALQLL
ncbi:DUF7919 family protein [Streptomyces erythrochromogenes]|uniref:DUF7919 family protein n=1 Tax=Streptomyces erythrochromogenes TaxID=285574 RepID=UPI0038031187